MQKVCHNLIDIATWMQTVFVLGFYEKYLQGNFPFQIVTMYVSKKEARSLT